VDATDIKRELDDLTPRQKALKKRLAEAAAERDRLLALPDVLFSQRDVDEASDEMARLERNVHDLDLRVDALKRQLPSKDELKSATAELDGLLKNIPAANERHRTAWTKLVEALAALEPLATELTSARRDAQRLEAQAQSRARKFALNAEVPSRWSPTPLEAKVVYLRGLALSELAFGDPSDTVTLDLTNATRDLARAS
jgi:chromosome segregation ATPase